MATISGDVLFLPKSWDSYIPTPGFFTVENYAWSIMKHHDNRCPPACGAYAQLKPAHLVPRLQHVTAETRQLTWTKAMTRWSTEEIICQGGSCLKPADNKKLRAVSGEQLIIATVDGRNPAPVDRWFIPLFIGFQPSKVVQDFFHQQYHVTMLISSVSTFWRGARSPQRNPVKSTNEYKWVNRSLSLINDKTIVGLCIIIYCKSV